MARGRGQNADPYNYTGPLYAASNGQTLFGSYVAPQGAIAGTVSVHFSDDRHGTLTWPGGTVAIERQIFGGTGAAFQPFSGWWWNADESGSGYSVELQGTSSSSSASCTTIAAGRCGTSPPAR